MVTELEKSPISEIKYGRIAPTVSVSDIPRAINFYTNVLGMKKTFENGNPVGFVILKRGTAELHLSLARNHVASDRNIAHLLVGDAKGLHDHLIKHGIRIIKGLRDADHGLRGFVFSDPDGNRIDVGQLLDPSAQTTGGAQ